MDHVINDHKIPFCLNENEKKKILFQVEPKLKKFENIQPPPIPKPRPNRKISSQYEESTRGKNRSNETIELMKRENSNEPRRNKQTKGKCKKEKEKEKEKEKVQESKMDKTELKQNDQKGQKRNFSNVADDNSVSLTSDQMDVSSRKRAKKTNDGKKPSTRNEKKSASTRPKTQSDQERLERMARNRASAERSRQKRIQYLKALEEKNKLLEDRVTALLLENNSLKTQLEIAKKSSIETMTISTSTDESNERQADREMTLSFPVSPSFSSNSSETLSSTDDRMSYTEIDEETKHKWNSLKIEDGDSHFTMNNNVAEQLNSTEQSQQNLVSDHTTPVSLSASQIPATQHLYSGSVGDKDVDIAGNLECENMDTETCTDMEQLESKLIEQQPVSTKDNNPLEPKIGIKSQCVPLGELQPLMQALMEELEQEIQHGQSVLSELESHGKCHGKRKKEEESSESKISSTCSSQHSLEKIKQGFKNHKIRENDYIVPFEDFYPLNPEDVNDLLKLENEPVTEFEQDDTDTSYDSYRDADNQDFEFGLNPLPLEKFELCGDDDDDVDDDDSFWASPIFRNDEDTTSSFLPVNESL